MVSRAQSWCSRGDAAVRARVGAHGEKPRALLRRRWSAAARLTRSVLRCVAMRGEAMTQPVRCLKIFLLEALHLQARAAAPSKLWAAANRADENMHP